MKSPCMDCPYRKVTCHDFCEEYQTYHDELVAAREALRVADNALRFLLDSAHKRERRCNTRK